MSKSDEGEGISCMEPVYERTALLLGEAGITALKKAHVAVFGIGGVGGYAVEALARAGVGELTLVDKDVVDPTNVNRQIIATTKTIGRPKVEVMRERIQEINPAIQVHARQCFYLGREQEKAFDFAAYNYVIDAVDTVTAKLALAVEADRRGTPIISCMGAGNKLDPTAFRVADIYETSVCPLAKVMRRELKARDIRHLKVVYSTEFPVARKEVADRGAIDSHIRTPAPGSVSFVPSVAGLILAGAVIRDLAENAKKKD